MTPAYALRTVFMNVLTFYLKLVYEYKYSVDDFAILFSYF